MRTAYYVATDTKTDLIALFIYLFVIAIFPLLNILVNVNNYIVSCERFEPRSHFKSRLSLIVRVNVVLNRTVVVDSD